MGQVRAWLAGAGFAIQEEAEGPWHQEGYAYHLVLARAGSAAERERVTGGPSWPGAAR